MSRIRVVIADDQALFREGLRTLLSTGSPYRAAREVVNDPDRFADALTGVYATDPQYGTTLKWVMDNYRLKQYD